MILSSTNYGRSEDHQTQRRLLEMVHGRDCGSRTGGLRAGQGLYDRPAQWIRHLGKDAAGSRRHVQGDGTSECLFPAVHSRELPSERSRTRGRIRSRSGRRDPRRRGEAGRAARDPSHIGNHYLEFLPQLDPVLSRPAAPHQSMVQRGAMGDANALVSPHDRVPLAGGPHGARDV